MQPPPCISCSDTENIYDHPFIFCEACALASHHVQHHLYLNRCGKCRVLLSIALHISCRVGAFDEDDHRDQAEDYPDRE